MNLNPNRLRRGDRVGMIGDSITCDARWWAGVRTGLLTAHPGCELEFRNLSIPGDDAGETLKRYDWDVAAAQPNAALVMLGMNDVWREGYGQEHPCAETLRKREKAVATFGENLARLMARLCADGVRVTVLSPTPYEQEAALDEPNLRGVDDALEMCTGLAEAVAGNWATFINLHGPMKEIGRRLRQSDARATLIGKDRVHPQDLGHAVIGRIVLNVLDSQDYVSAMAGVALSSVARVASAKKKSAWIWDYTAALPNPAEMPEALRLLRAAPRQIVLRANIAPGQWSLRIDDVPVCTCRAEEWVAGVDLAPAASPLRDRALAIHAAGQAVDREEKRYRNLLMFQGWFVREGGVNESPEFIDYLDRRAAEPSPEDWLRIAAEDAKLLLGTLPEHHEKVSALRHALAELARPWRYRCELINES